MKQVESDNKAKSSQILDENYQRMWATCNQLNPNPKYALR